MSKKVSVFKGGFSSEREVSLVSGAACAKALKESGYDVVEFDVTRDMSALIEHIKQEKPDVIFNALHGRYGEDGRIQGLLDIMQIPYTHSGQIASALAMDKALTRDICIKNNIPMAKGYIADIKDILDEKIIPLPFVIKPVNEGSSVGVTLVLDKESLDKLKNKGWEFDNQVLVEEYIPGRELTIAIMEGKALGVLEIVPNAEDGWYDFSTKYTDGMAVHRVPTDIAKKDFDKMMDYAQKTHEVLGCRGATRADFRYDDTNKNKPARIILLELNTQPGMTPLSLVPEIAGHQGISFNELVCQMVENAKCDQ